MTVLFQDLFSSSSYFFAIWETCSSPHSSDAASYSAVLEVDSSNGGSRGNSQRNIYTFDFHDNSPLCIQHLRMQLWERERERGGGGGGGGCESGVLHLLYTTRGKTRSFMSGRARKKLGPGASTTTSLT